TQTSAMQVRVMEKSKLPLRVIVPGKTYRYEQVDASHGFEFWQLEGFAVDENITLTDLFGTISYVLKKLIGEKTKLRFACTNFPFVEPAVDTYIECTVCSGRGCSFCKQSGWSEIMPAGMIHPNVLKAAKIDPQKWQGYAFCLGLSRVVNLRFGMDDLRLLVNPDLRILNQF
ncbi:phenylalanine--tRNA ligase subunit alpha, partial [Candidatus Microgenomates bacterium]|nr:phenylalanine--tRNA ligase subunit alpha [Candidatus Microgenomates bacterium]